jgi:hypothetical protein
MGMIMDMAKGMEIAVGRAMGRERRGNRARMLMSGNQSSRARKLDERCDARRIEYYQAYVQERPPNNDQ